ncbi:hypothetical protein MASR1M46_00290 [Bacteroidales bacterium]
MKPENSGGGDHLQTVTIDADGPVSRMKSALLTSWGQSLQVRGDKSNGKNALFRCTESTRVYEGSGHEFNGHML